MAEAPKPTLNAYAVAIVFAPPKGVICVNSIVAPNPETAIAMVMHQVMRDLKPEEDLTGIAVTQINLEWLRFAVHAVETGQGGGGQVLSLVREQPATAASQALGDQSSAPRPPQLACKCPGIPGQTCPLTAAECQERSRLYEGVLKHALATWPAHPLDDPGDPAA